VSRVNSAVILILIPIAWLSVAAVVAAACRVAAAADARTPREPARAAAHG
jgi:hypothetical protein